MAAAVGTAANTAQNNWSNRRYGRLIIAAVDGDGDRLVGVGAEFVGDTSCVGLGDALPFFQGLCCSRGVVEGVGPDARCGINGDGAIGGRWGANQRPAEVGAGVEIGGGEGATHAGRAGINGAVIEMTGFPNSAQCATSGGGDHRGVVAACDGDVDRLIGCGALVVGDADGVLLGRRGAGGECLCGRQVVVEGVGPGAGAGVDGQIAVSGWAARKKAPVRGCAAINVESCQDARNARGTGSHRAVSSVSSLYNGAVESARGYAIDREIINAPRFVVNTFIEG